MLTSWDPTLFPSWRTSSRSSAIACCSAVEATTMASTSSGDDAIGGARVLTALGPQTGSCSLAPVLRAARRRKFP